MCDPFNPFDRTVWDPGNPERAIEDPFHGPSAVLEMLQTPAMPLGDGTYYQPGGSYAFGTNYLDSRGQPVHGSLRMMSAGETGLDGGQDLREWVETYQEEGEEGLADLEARRQQKRLEENGVVHAFKPTDVCGGGKKIEDCETASGAIEIAEVWGNVNSKPEPVESEGVIWNVLPQLSGKCGECALSCEVAVKTVDGQAQEIRFSNVRPNPDIPVLIIEPNEPVVLSQAMLETLGFNPPSDK